MKKFLLTLPILCILWGCVASDPPGINQENESTKSHPAWLKQISVDDAKKKLAGIMLKTRSGEEDIDSYFELAVEVEGDSTSPADTIAFPPNHDMDTVTYAYVFNYAADGGFAIVSAVEGLPDLIAFSAEGNLTPDIQVSPDEIINPGLKIYIPFLDEWAKYQLEQMKTEMDDFLDAYYTTEYLDNQYINGPDGLNVPNWGQKDPYNRKCGSGRYLAGCLPIAVAQIMAYHRYPDSYKNDDYDWDLIMNSNFITSDEIDNDRAYMASSLIARVGEQGNLSVKYGKEESLAEMPNVKRTYMNFGYSSCSEEKKYDKSLVIESLQNGYPCIIGGFQQNAQVGHAWVACGLMHRRFKKEFHCNGKVTSTEILSYNYFYYNWGHKGQHNGFYLSDVFDTSHIYENESGTIEEPENGLGAYNTKLSMIYNIRP